jgi:hypothetical protein
MSASVGATRAFLPTLRRLDSELALPLPERVSVLREIEADLEELTGSLVARGHGLDEARRMALEALVPAGSALGDLSLAHASTYDILTRRLGGPRLQLLERSALALATTGVIVLEAAALLAADLRFDPSPFLWPVLGLSGLLFATIAAKAFTLWIKRDHREPDRGLGAILVLCGLLVATGFGGAFVDFFLLVQSLERAPDVAMGPVLQWLRRDGALLSVTLLASMVGGLTWFILTQWLSALAAARRDVLGLRADNTMEIADHE